MKPTRTDSQPSVFSYPLEKILAPEHPLLLLAKAIDWSQFDDLADECYSEEGRPGCNTPLMIGLLYLKHAFDESDESVVNRWVENPYWQFFFAAFTKCNTNARSIHRVSAAGENVWEPTV